MGIKVTTDVFCDSCSNWAHHSVGEKSEKTAALAAARAGGWKKVVVDGDVELHCPCCLGSEPDYWKSWFKGKRTLTHTY